MDNTSTTTTLLIALAGGAVGAVVTAVLAFGARLLRVGREIEANDRALRVLDDHLETWVSDDTVRLRRELTAITEAANKENLFWSSTHYVRIGQAKERALQSYRDQERTARSHEGDIVAREGRLHGFVRAWKFEPIGLRAPDRVRPILDRWAAPVTRHSVDRAEPQEINDPRKRTVETTLAALEADPTALT